MSFFSEDEINSNSEKKVVVIIGLGQLGLPVAKYVKEHGFDTYGYDINQKTMQSSEANYGIKQVTNFGDFDGLNFYDGREWPLDRQTKTRASSVIS
ncbi:hypothetical protein BH23THE1_BH23THE1_21710 [soil metagenome]